MTRLSTASETANDLIAGLEYRSFGPESGRPVFYFHGCPGSAQEISWLPRRVLDEANLRIIAVNRPGFGRSVFHEQRSLTDFARQIAELAAALGIQEYDILGFSAGGPYALACAYTHPEQIRNVSLLACVAPLDKPGVLAGLPELNRSVLLMARDDAPTLEAQLAAQLQDGQDVLAMFETVISETDKIVFDDRHFRECYHQALDNGIQQGVKPIVQDMNITTSPWDFDIENIDTPVYLWQGENDNNVSNNMFTYFSETLPNVYPSQLKDAGHYFFYEAFEKVLNKVIA